MRIDSRIDHEMRDVDIFGRARARCSGQPPQTEFAAAKLRIDAPAQTRVAPVKKLLRVRAGTSGARSMPAGTNPE